MKTTIICQDKYEAQKLTSLIFIKDGKETFINQVLNIIDNEVVISLKDKSAHSILLKDLKQAENFVDFIQSVTDKEHKIIDIITLENQVEIIKE